MSFVINRETLPFPLRSAMNSSVGLFPTLTSFRSARTSLPIVSFLPRFSTLFCPGIPPAPRLRGFSSSNSRTMAATDVPKAEYRQLGKSGLRVSVPIFGAMSFGDKRWANWVIEEDEVPSIPSPNQLNFSADWDT